MSTTFTQVLDLQNSTAKPKELWIEPWGDKIVLPVKQKIRVVAEGPVGNLDIDFTEETVTVYGWPGSTLSIHDGHQSLWSCSVAAPLQMPPAAGKRK